MVLEKRNLKRKKKTSIDECHDNNNLRHESDVIFPLDKLIVRAGVADIDNFLSIPLKTVHTYIFSQLLGKDACHYLHATVSIRSWHDICRNTPLLI